MITYTTKRIPQVTFADSICDCHAAKAYNHALQAPIPRLLFSSSCKYCAAFIRVSPRSFETSERRHWSVCNTHTPSLRDLSGVSVVGLYTNHERSEDSYAPAQLLLRLSTLDSISCIRPLFVFFTSERYSSKLQALKCSSLCCVSRALNMQAKP